MLQDLHNWISTGPDEVHSLVDNTVKYTHKKLIIMIKEIISYPPIMPLYLIKETTFIIRKNAFEENSLKQ